MNWMLPSITATLICSTLLLLIYIYLYFRENRQPVLLIWIFAWIFYCLRFVAMLFYLKTDGQAEIWQHANLFFSLLSGVMLFQGAFYLYESRTKKTLSAFLILFILIHLFTIVFSDNHYIYVIALYFFIGVVFIYTGIIFYTKTKPKKIESSFIALVFIFWGLHKFNYPFLHDNERYAPIGYILGAVFALFIAFSLILFYLQMAKDELNKNKQLLQSTNKELIIALKKAKESDKLKSEFIQNLSHEIRTPMNGILGFADLLKKPDLTLERRRNFIDHITRSSNDLLRTIEGILEISILHTNPEAVYNEVFNLKYFIQDILSEFNERIEKKGLSVRFDINATDETCNISTDKDKLKKILCNIIDNAVKFTSKGYIEIDCKITNKAIHIFIKDTGCGIHANDHNYVFQRFTQIEASKVLAKNGLGLGLYIAQEYALQLGGEIRLDSAPDLGSVFEVRIQNH